MSYRTIVVGTDGSESSLRAVDRAAVIAAQEKAKLVIASAHLDTSEKGGWSRPPSPDRLIDGRAADSLGQGESYRMHGSASVYAILQDARERAKAAGAHEIEEQAIVGAPVNALLTGLFGAELAWLKHATLPIGVSIVVIAQRPTAPA